MDSVRELALPRLLFSTFFGWSVFCDSFSHLYLSTYLLSHGWTSLSCIPILLTIWIYVICKSTHLEIHPHSEVTSKSYKSAFHSGHLFHNMSYGGAAIIQVFHLPQQRYSYPTQSFITELLLSVSQHWNLCSG